MNHAEVLAQYLGTFVDELVASGLEHVCLCPGSRSTPLALTFARHPGIKVWTHLDERSCAYFALGMAKYSRRPVAILCSSGTAAVNFAPAVVEAFQAGVPLLVLTADRPQELRDLGSNQTIDQVKLYGGAAKWFVEMLLPESNPLVLRYARMVARRAVTEAVSGFPGPVHLNFPLREPLIPEIGAWANQEPLPKREVPTTPNSPDKQVIGAITEAANRAQRGLIVCGPQDDWDLLVPLQNLASAWGAPILADPLSGLRGGLEEGIWSYDNFLRDPKIAVALKPDMVIRFGAPPTSKPLAGFLTRHLDVPQILVCPEGTWRDAELTASQVITADARLFSAALADGVSDKVPRDEFWRLAWERADEQACKAIERCLTQEEALSEPQVFVVLSDEIPEGSTLFAGNSMPVRDLDSFFPSTSREIRMLANRGASGIDGVVSTALGTAAVSPGRVVLVIGDLSFYHDMNGLLAAKRHGLKATIVLINNDGGGIFSFLPQNDDQEHFELLFGTPHGLDFEPVAKLYGLGWTRVTTREEYRNALKASFDAEGVQVIEVKTDRVENLKLHQRIWTEVTKAVEGIEVEAST